MNIPPVCYCGRLVCVALPLTVLPPFHFDTKMYCSPRCAELHSRGENRTPTGSLITCDVCCEDKPLTEYIHKITKHDVVTDQWNLLAPVDCLPHLAPELLNLEGGTCTECLRSHILAQLETRGAVNINCIQSHATPLPPELRSSEQISLLKSEQWLPYAQQFLPKDLHDVFYQQLFDHFIHNTTATLWVCPSDCGYGDGILQTSDTPGFPHVECPGCHDRFCVNCKVLWHDGQTCQQYRAQHLELRDQDEVRQLHEMARLGARRCPRCQFIIVKEGGCNHVHCEQCRFDFNFPEAERVVAPPPDYVPAPADSAAASSFKGWGQLRQAQQDHIDRNHIADEPFDISIKASQHEAGVFYYDPDTNLWAPDICELDEIAGRAEGRRYVRREDRDRDDLWAFVAVEDGQQGSGSLHEALLLELQSPTSPIPIPTEILRILEGSPLFGNADNMVEHPFQVVFEGDHVGDQDPAAPALAALDQLINNLSAEEGPHEAQESGADEGIQQAGANDQPIPHPLFDMLGPPRDATDALIDRMLMTAMEPGVGQVVFGFGLGMPLMHLFDGDEDGGRS
ncbi:hypothetical protein E8E11_004650 [Didymella keratinophila]|nr:hypothetical protein E8E11_004650 [Didymella keratinophila]